MQKVLPDSRFNASELVEYGGGPGLMRQHQVVPGPNHYEGVAVNDYIPQSGLTDNLRSIWEVLQGLREPGEEAQTFEEYYREQSAGGSSNGRALATLLFYRARQYWPDYFSPADLPAVAAWAGILDWYPLITPDIIEAAVDHVHDAGIREPQPANFLRIARQMSGEVL
jgi:hypothetical protein